MQPKISIIVPVYNAEKTLAKCVNSIINQSYNNIEIILINDGSRDSSLEVIKTLYANDHRIKYINQQNSGVSNARNNGLKKAVGDYVVFVDSDDYIGENFIENYIKLLDRNPNALIYQSFTSEYLDRNKKEVLPDKIYQDDGILDAIMLLEEKRCLGGACNKIFRMNIIKNYNIFFNESFSYGEDKIFTLDYLKHISTIVLSSHTDYYYNRKHNGSLSQKYHKSSELLHFCELEYVGFRNLQHNVVKPEFDKMINARYSSFLKYVLLSMYRKEDIANQSDRVHLAAKISTFDKHNLRDKNFETEVPKIINYLFESDLGMKVLMLLKTRFSTIYREIYKNRLNG